MDPQSRSALDATADMASTPPMQLPADYHLHTPLCRHAVGRPTDYAARALALGLTEIGFSDHSPMAEDDFDGWRMPRRDLDTYVQLVEDARRDHPGLSIRLALEVDWLPGQEGWIRELADRHPWDYLIGSVHYITEAWAIDDPATLPIWKQKDPDRVWADYVELLTRAAQSRLFDLIGHIDLPKKFGFYPKTDVLPLYDRFLQTARESDVAIEINTAGLRKDCREFYPAPAILEIACRHGVSLAFGSDAHAPDEVGFAWADAVELARRAGYTQTCRWTGRRRTLLPL